jgi:hypothetical protein
MKTITIGVDAITIPERLRPFNPKKMEGLVESMTAIGLQMPISVWTRGDGNDVEVFLVAGRHRLEAAKKLGWADIEAFDVALNDVDRQLWEIDENLMRSELTPTEEAEHVARRKELWEARQKVGQVAPLSTGRGHKGFAADTAAKTGKDKRTINRAIQRAAEVTSEARDLIRNTSLDTGAYLDRLMKVPEEQQVERVERDLATVTARERSETLRREAAEREREAKEAKKHAKIAVCDFLLDALSPKQWDHLIGLIDAAGGALRSADLREWQAPVAGEAA